MSPRRRAALLAGLAIVLGALAASDMAGREAALRGRLGPAVGVVTLRRSVARGARIGRSALAVRRVPARYAPAGAFSSPGEVVGARAAVALPAGFDLHPSVLAGGEAGVSGDPLAGARPGERIARIVAIGDARELAPGTRADVLITRDDGSDRVSTRLALSAAEVVSAEPAGSDGEGDLAGLPRVALALRVSVAQAIALVEAQNGARELRVLPRPAG
ncbi:unannotated protein [freshwater metagenome]|uniref:Unannotated protein n=1 Tax=freshwater metagenome TaxID=449393 RepID=A0A6J7DL90_9ZZZZ|nr:hypothetical protein [Actinomycetota bacterium]